MMQFYADIRLVHIGAVITSLTLFALRGMLMLGEVPWRHHRALRIVPPVVDTVLLASALTLIVLLHQYPFVQAWLTVKVLAVLLYIALGSVALKYGRTRRMRVVAYFAALATAAFIVGVARRHDPWGWLAPLLR